MTKRLRLSLVGLATSLSFLVAVASVTPADADLTCDELAACEGAAGCHLGGNPIGCELDCTGGGEVTCGIKD